MINSVRFTVIAGHQLHHKLSEVKSIIFTKLLHGLVEDTPLSDLVLGEYYFTHAHSVVPPRH